MTYNTVEGIRLGNVFFSYNSSNETVSAEIIPNVMVFKVTTIQPSYNNIDTLTQDSDKVVSTLSKYCFTIAPNIGISGVANLQCALDLKISCSNFEQLKCSYDPSIFNNHLCSLHINNNLKCSWSDRLSQTEGDILYSQKIHTHDYIPYSFNTLVVDGIEYPIIDNINIEGCGLTVTFDSNTKTLTVSTI